MSPSLASLSPRNYFGLTTIVLGTACVSLQTSRRNVEEPVVALADSGEQPWQNALATLDELLKREAGRKHPPRTRVVVSNAFARYLLAPWAEQQLSAAERQHWIKALFTERYGERAKKWHAAVEPQRFEQPALAAALDDELLAALQSMAKRHGLRLQSVEPSLVHQLNQQRQRLAKVKSGWFVDVSDGQVVCLAFVDHVWSQVSNERCDEAQGGLGNSLLPLLRRDALRFPSLLGGTVFLQNTDGLGGSIEPAFPVVRLTTAQGAAA